MALITRSSGLLYPLQAGLGFEPQSRAISAIYAEGIEAVAIVQVQQFSQRGLGLGQNWVSGGAAQPCGEGFAGGAGQATLGETFFELVEFRIQPGPASGVAWCFLGVAKPAA